ncbi:hypothetical protein NPIL_80481 [Nephila pilipes]|uniref:Uncharacterized protein n=1 Tax=Nephila pilipes TaxID=299642 RepID=A0A8X6PL87_NEPPI|nr:hypothetical protein NPIL_80481 [Nephila pilipes]
MDALGAEKPDPGSQECKNGNQSRSLDAVHMRGKCSCSESSQAMRNGYIPLHQTQGRYNDVETSQFTSEEKCKVAFNATPYCETLTKFKSVIRRKRPGLLSPDVIPLDDNAKPHTAKLLQDQIRCFGRKRLYHSAQFANRTFACSLP